MLQMVEKPFSKSAIIPTPPQKKKPKPQNDNKNRKEKKKTSSPPTTPKENPQKYENTLRVNDFQEK